MTYDITKIRKLIGKITKDQLRYVDCYIGRHIGLFMPVGGACFQALSPLHSHPSYLFVLNFDDSTTMRLGKLTVTGRPGTFLALSPDIAHHELPSDSPPRYIAVLIDRIFFEEQLQQYPLGKKISFCGECFSAPPSLLISLKKFMFEAGGNLPGREKLLDAIGSEIAHILIRSIFGITSRDDRVSSRIEINRVIEFMHSNPGADITVESLAGIAYMSTSHFSRVFRKETGRTPMDYLGRVRMARVKKLLLAGDKSITEIALECGFKSSSYLSACFRKKFRISPSGYCKNSRKSKQ
jgi:AraC family transcriptional regulator